MTTHLLFTQTTKPTKEQSDKIKEIFTPEYIIKSSKTISISKEQDSVIKVRDIQINELLKKIELLKKEHNQTLIDIAKYNNDAQNASKKIDSISDKQIGLDFFKGFKITNIHLYTGLEIPKINIPNTNLNAELMLELNKIHFGIKGQIEPDIISDNNRYIANYFIKIRYKLF